LLSSTYVFIGGRQFEDGDALLVKFTLQSISGRIQFIGDIDRLQVTYLPFVNHISCISPNTYPSIIVKAKEGFIFHSSVYFHRNFRTDGWEELIGIHRSARGLWEIWREGYKRDGKIRGRTGLREATEKDKALFSQDFPDFPPEPQFWMDKETGSKTGLWPPRLFQEWVKDRNRGEVPFLDLPPATLTTLPHMPPIAGPSCPRGPSSAHNPPSPSTLSNHSSCLSSVPPSPQLSITDDPSSSTNPIPYPEPPAEGDGSDYGFADMSDSVLEAMIVDGLP
jgi:hypothetical protein